MKELYPVILLLASFLICLAIIFFSGRKKITHSKKKSAVLRSNTVAIDMLINNSNSGIEVSEYKKALSKYDINYVAWKVKRNESSKQ